MNDLIDGIEMMFIDSHSGYELKTNLRMKQFTVKNIATKMIVLVTMLNYDIDANDYDISFNGKRYDSIEGYEINSIIFNMIGHN